MYLNDFNNIHVTIQEVGGYVNKKISYMFKRNLALCNQENNDQRYSMIIVIKYKNWLYLFTSRKTKTNQKEKYIMLQLSLEYASLVFQSQNYIIFLTTLFTISKKTIKENENLSRFPIRV
jgi:hypothetical protein